MEQSCCCSPPRLPTPSAGPTVAAVLKDDISGKLRCQRCWDIGLDWSESAPPMRIGCPRDPSRGRSKLLLSLKKSRFLSFSHQSRADFPSLSPYKFSTEILCIDCGKGGSADWAGSPIGASGNAPVCSGLPRRASRAAREALHLHLQDATTPLPQRPPGGLAHPDCTKPDRSARGLFSSQGQSCPSPLKSHLSLSCLNFRANSS